MIIYNIELFDSSSEELIRKVEIPKSKLESISEIMEWNTLDKTSFFRGIGGFDVTKEQALSLENVLGIKFYAEGMIIQIAGGEI